MVAGHCGARNVILTDVNEYRLDLAKRIVPKVQPINVAKQEITRNFMESLGILEGFRCLPGNVRVSGRLP